MAEGIRKRVSVVVVHEGKILGFHAVDPHSQKEYFFLPGGKIEEGEVYTSTAIRETLEETGYSITLLENIETCRKYVFKWNGKDYHCETWYLAGTLESVESEEVNDALYNKGPDWVPVDEVETFFSYHKDVLEPIQEILRELERL